MKRLLCLFLVLIVSMLAFVACTPDNLNSDTSSDSGVNTDSLAGDSDSNVDSDTSSDTDSNVNTDTDSDVDTDTDTDTDSDVDTDTDSKPSDTDTDSKPSDTDIGGGNEDTEKKEITISKTATELASSIGASVNGDIVSNNEIKLDNNISVSFNKGTSSTEPALYSGAIRIYQKGGTLTVNANDGCQIQKVIITFTSEKDGNGFLTVSGGSVPTVTDETITITSKASKKVTVTVGGTSKEDRLYVSAIEVVYTTNGSADGGNESDFLYNDFTSEEKETYNEYIGFVIPFMPNNDYYIEGYDEDGYRGVYFSALCESELDFDAYFEAFSSYEYEGSDTDDYGDTWYFFLKNNIFVDACYYEYEGAYYVDVDAYFEVSGGEDEAPTENIITNEGAGLPSNDGDGIYDVDFTVADKVKDVTDQGYYLDGCPTVGAPGVLVIPVEFSDRTASSLGYDISNIKKAFEKNGENDYFSVYDYYFKSSLGKLNLDITVVDEWFMPSKASTYYANYTIDYEGEKTLIGDQLVMDEALKYLDKTMDLSKFDSDNNGIIDAVVLVTTLKIDAETEFYWAYRFWNIYTNSDEYYFEYDEVSAKDYLWASYEFLHEDTNLTGDYSNKDIINPYTFIHEFGHILGADDYYDTHYYGSPLGGYDIMDRTLGDHNPYTKFNLGWITSSRLVVTDSTVTLTLEDFSKNGDTIIIANNFDVTLGVYQEYYVLMYYTDSELNSGIGGYFDKNGIVVYHVDASLFYEEYEEEYEGEIYYNVYNTNTDAVSEYGTINNLIELMPHGSEYVYIQGETMKDATDNTGAVLGYTFIVNDLNENEATITVSAK